MATIQGSGNTQIPVTGTDATRVNLTFDNNTTDLSEIDMQLYYAQVIHKIQTEHSQLRNFVTHDSIKGTFKWRKLTPKRDPQQRRAAVPTLNPRKQTFENVGITLQAYDDEAWLVDYTVENSQINFQSTLAEAMMMGYERLFDRVAIAAMMEPVRYQESSDWDEGQKTTKIVSLENDRIGAAVAAAGNALAKPSFNTFQKIIRKFHDNNVDFRTQICGLLTPAMQEILEGIAEYNDKDYIFSKMSDPNVASFNWKNICWVKCTPEVAPGAYYSDLYVTAASGGSPLSVATDTSSGNIDLTDSNHEVIPFWVTKNIFVGTNPALDKFSITQVPYYRDTPIMYKTQWLGGSRIQNLYQFNLVIPVG